jgi:hypothetical protein
MPNWCSNNIVVTGPVEEIAHFRQTCIRQNEKGESYFDFNSLIPMPKILAASGTSSGTRRSRPMKSQPVLDLAGAGIPRSSSLFARLSAAEEVLKKTRQ